MPVLFTQKAFRLLLLPFCLALAACAGKQPLLPDTSSQTARQLYAERVANFTDTPFRANFSVRAGIVRDGVSDTRRVTGIIWGNPGSPVRMDIAAGIGASLLRAWTDENRLLLYLPGENILYTARAAVSGEFRLMDIAMPFGAWEIAALARGAFGLVFPPDEVALPADPPATGERALTKRGRRGELSLSPSGLPVCWIDDETGWRVEFSYRDQAAHPFKITANNAEGATAVFLIRELERPSPFDDTRLTLNIPANARVLPLEAAPAGTAAKR